MILEPKVLSQVPQFVLAQQSTAAAQLADKAEQKIEQATDRAAQLWKIAQTYAIEFTPKVLGAIVVLFITWTLANWARRFLSRGMERASLDVTLVRFLANAARYAIIVLGVLACLSTFGLNVTSFIAILSAVGLAIGLALQGTLSHVASGIMLLIFRPFKVGDTVIISGQTGVVDEIELFSTTLDTADRRRVIIPNGAIFGSTITNLSHHPVRIATIKVAVAVGTDASTARRVLLEAAAKVASAGQGGAAEPGPTVALAEAGVAHVWNVSVGAQAMKFDSVIEQLTLATGAAVGSAGIAPAPPVTLVRNVG